MARRLGIMIGVLLVVSGCAPLAHASPTPSPIPVGTTPKEAILGRPVTDADCFATDFVVVSVPDAPTRERHVRMAAARPGWLPSHGFLGTPTDLALAVQGQLIGEDPQDVWILVPDTPGPRAERYFPLVAATGDRVWYHDGSITACL